LVSENEKEVGFESSPKTFLSGKEHERYRTGRKILPLLGDILLFCENTIFPSSTRINQPEIKQNVVF
jgi:hypothetical protein